MRKMMMISDSVLFVRVLDNSGLASFGYIGVVGRMDQDLIQTKSRPKLYRVVLQTRSRPKPYCVSPSHSANEFSGAGDWTTWLRKFQRLAGLYSWETSEKLIWLEAKLSGQAARAFEVIDEDTKKDFDGHGIVEILTRRFEPESRQLLYQEKLFAFQRKGGEDWATVAENIKELAARAHPSSDGLAEGFALSRFLTLLEEVAVGVRRSAPKTLDEAVREATRLDSMLIEMLLFEANLVFLRRSCRP